MRPMFLDFPQEEDLFKLGSQFMWGDSFLVSPKLESPKRRDLKRLKLSEDPHW